MIAAGAVMPGGRRRAMVAMLLVPLLTAANDVSLGPPPLRLIDAVSPRGVQEVTPGAVIARAAIGRPDSALIGETIALDWKGEKRSIERGDMLHAQTVTEVKGLPDAVFCEDEHEGSLGKVMTGQMLFGMVGALRGTRLNTRYCLYDADKDGRFDHALLLGAKGKEGRAPFAIPQAKYALIEGIPLGSDVIARIRYAGPAGNKGSISFDLEVFGFGKLRDIPEPRHTVPIAKLPAYAIIEGALVTVLKYDPETMQATLRMDHDLAPGHIILPELSRAYTDGETRR